MIKGFEKETAELSDIEKETAKLLSNILQKHVGKDKAIINQDLKDYMIMEYNVSPRMLSPVRIRKMINYIRKNGMVNRLAATSNGYFIAESDLELTTYIESLRQRANEINAVADELVSQLNPAKGQLILTI